MWKVSSTACGSVTTITSSAAVRALMVRYSPCSSFQWNGTKQLPGRTRSVTTAGSTAGTGEGSRGGNRAPLQVSQHNHSQAGTRAPEARYFSPTSNAH